MKKGYQQITAANVALIIIAVAFIIWFGFGEDIKELIEDLGYGGTCKLSMLATHVSGKSEGVLPKIPPSCKTDRKSVYLSDLYEGEKLALKFNPGFSEKEALRWNAQRIVADALVDCFEKGWRGNIDIKGTGFSDAFVTMFKDEPGAAVCLLCSRIRFDDEVQKVIGKYVYMTDFLQNNFYRGETYYDYLTRDVNKLQKSMIDSASTFDISKPLAIVYVAAAEKERWELGTSLLGFTGVFDYSSITRDLGLRTKYGLVFDYQHKMHCGVVFSD